MNGKYFLDETAPQVGQEPILPTPPEPARKSRKKLFVLIGVIAVAAVLLAVVLILSVPQGLGETIPYGYNYTVGERLTYSISITMNGAGTQVSETGNIILHVVGFDGDNYTIDETVHYDVQGVSSDYSYTIVTNKAGQWVSASNLPPSSQSMYSMMQGMPGVGLALNRTTVREGQTIQIPINISNSSLSFTGTFNIKVGNIENVTVASGTYKTFKIELSSSDVHMMSQGFGMSASLTGQSLLEYGTCHVIDFDMQETVMGMGETVSMSMSMTLTGDTIG